MRKGTFSLEQKQRFVEEYREETGSTTLLVAEKVADWCNNHYVLPRTIYGRDFLRPAEMKTWFDAINDAIAKTVTTEDGIIHVFTSAGIDIEKIFTTCRTEKDLKRELMAANERFSDVITTNQKLIKTIKDLQEQLARRDRQLATAQENAEALQYEVKKRNTKYFKQYKDERSKRLEANKNIQFLMRYICRYVTDPYVTAHLSADLKLFKTDPEHPIVLPECMREIIPSERSLEDIAEVYAEWFSDDSDTESAEEDDDNEELLTEEESGAQESCIAEILTAKESNFLQMLEGL